MARALIVGCGCRGRELAAGLIERGWLVRGTTRNGAAAPDIADAGAEPELVDPGDLAALLERIGDVTLVYWLLGSARGDPKAVEQLHGDRLERLLEELVDTPVRGFVYEAAGEVEPALLQRGAARVREAAERWRLRAWVIEAAASSPEDWREAMLAPADRLTGAG
jgi:uncharacterized protein YbjT (DUF2867 family)